MLSTGFEFVPTSKFRDKSEPQEAMMDTIRSSVQNGILVAPCGCGKSAVIIEALMDAGTLGLILCYESQGVYQMADAIRNNTTLMANQLCVFSGKYKDVPSGKFCIFITTYGMFAASRKHCNEATKRARDFVFNTKWDLVCCDEVHHAGATTYQPMIEKLAQTSKRMLGFTATLYRSEMRTCKLQSIEREAKAFRWFGNVIFRRTSKELEEAGLIAKIRRATVCVEFTREFALAYEAAVGAQNTYLAALNPAKLNALVSLVRAHTAMGHRGIVFANHLLVAKVVTECLGEGWLELSGGIAHGQEETTRTAEKNARIVERFNAGELEGMVCTAVGESSMDVHYDKFCFVCVVDADGGFAAAGQRLGRVARSERLNQDDGESQDQLTARRLEKQKAAWYYDFITLGTTECDAAQTREQLFEIEGYREVQVVFADKLREMAGANEVQLPFVTLTKQMQLLKEVLTYNTLREVCAVENEAAAASQHPQRAKVKTNQAAMCAAKNGIAKELLHRKLKHSKRALSVSIAKSKQKRRSAIENHSLNAAARRIFASLQLSAEVLKEVGIFEKITTGTSSDGEDGEEDEGGDEGEEDGAGNGFATSDSEMSV